MSLADRLISESVRENRTVHVQENCGVSEDLIAMCEDHNDNGDEHEYWGTDDAGNEWRVHVRPGDES